MTESHRTPEIPIDPAIRFGIHLQDLASSIEVHPPGEDLTKPQMRVAQWLAETFAKNRTELMQEYGADPHPAAAELLGIDVYAKPDLTLSSVERQAQERNKTQLKPLAGQLDHDEQTRLAIGAFLRTLPNPNVPRRGRPPKAGWPALNGAAVVDALFAYGTGKLAFDQVDRDAAEHVAAETHATEQKREVLEGLSNNPEAIQFTADAILYMFTSAPHTPRTRVGIKADSVFKTMLAQRFPGIGDAMIAELFHSSWSYIQEFFKDIDPSYEVFQAIEGTRNRGRQYVLQDPELVNELWDEESVEGEVAPAEEQTEKGRADAVKVQTFTDAAMLMSDGSAVINSDVIREFRAMMKTLTKQDPWLSRGHAAQTIAKNLGMRRDDVEQEIKRCVNQLGTGFVEQMYSRRGNRVLMKRGSKW